MKPRFPVTRRAITAGVLVLLLAGCSDMTTQQQRMLSGGAIGAGTGAAVGAITGGSAVTGAVIGGAAGTGAGYLYDQDRKKRGR
jgi:osmotically inducible lipoprotein OsmB